MRKFIETDFWTPRGVEKLEFNAEKVVKEINNNILVSAGPGSGKTELLAQKACYLLETNQCKFPKKILAISFKKDAAKNLKDRVELRVGKELSNRFDSFTFDAFAVNILSRFRNGLPDNFRPTINYKVDLNLNNRFVMQELIRSFEGQKDLLLCELNSLNPSTFERDYLCKNKLFLEKKINNSIGEKVSELIWNKKIREIYPSELSFNMINRLSEFILRMNPFILKYLRQTYEYVFLDEFQDTTQIQYDLLITCFKGSNLKLTAVGDNKQRIMGWAGALKDVFSIFVNDFSAKHINLYSNYRSAPCLVKIQQTIIKELEGQDALLPEPTNNCYKENDGICYAWAYENEESEAIHIADKIKELLNKDKIKPREICILVRNKPEEYTFRIIQKLIGEGIEARIEKEFQDLLTEPLIILMLDLFKLIIYKRSSNAWREVLDYLLNSIIISDDFYKNERKIEVELEHFIKECKNEIKLGINLNKIFVKTIKFLNIDKIKSIYPQYNQNDYWKNICNILYSKLNEYIENYSLADSIKRFEGENSIPIMTMHKSKGLEFHTVFFIGLEDSSLWNYKKNLNEETNGFFVAFSRAKEKIVFTFCRSRKKRAQNWSEIKRLYELLNSSGVILELIN